MSTLDEIPEFRGKFIISANQRCEIVRAYNVLIVPPSGGYKYTVFATVLTPDKVVQVCPLWNVCLVD